MSGRRVLITGADGFVGGHLCRRLQSAGYDVVRATRTQVGDIGADTDWGPVMNETDAVVHLAARVHVMQDTADDPLAAFRAVNRDGTRTLVSAAATAGVRHFLYLSSIKVNGENTGAEPFRGTDSHIPDDPYGLSKYEAEQAVRDIASHAGMGWTILRPPLVYGPGVRANFKALMGLCAREWPLPFGMIDNRRSLIYVGNLTDAIAVCLENPQAAGKTYLVSDGEDLSTAELVRRLGRALGRTPPLLPVPPALLRLAGGMTGRSATVARLLDSLVVDGAPIRSELAWTPPYTVDQGLAATAAWYGTADE